MHPRIPESQNHTRVEVERDLRRPSDLLKLGHVQLVSRSVSRCFLSTPKDGDFMTSLGNL